VKTLVEPVICAQCGHWWSTETPQSWWLDGSTICFICAGSPTRGAWLADAPIAAEFSDEELADIIATDRALIAQHPERAAVLNAVIAAARAELERRHPTTTTNENEQNHDLPRWGDEAPPRPRWRPRALPSADRSP